MYGVALFLYCSVDIFNSSGWLSCVTLIDAVRERFAVEELLGWSDLRLLELLIMSFTACGRSRVCVLLRMLSRRADAKRDSSGTPIMAALNILLNCSLMAISILTARSLSQIVRMSCSSLKFSRIHVCHSCASMPTYEFGPNMATNVTAHACVLSCR